MVQCNHPEANNRWHTKIQALHRWMELEVQTKPTVADAIAEGLNAWRNQQDRPWIPNQETREAAQEQENIGWWNLTMGIQSTKWQVIQKVYYARIGSKRSAR